MADPVLTQRAIGTSTTTTTTVSFSAQAAGTLLVLTIIADAYRATSGAGRPESSGWTLVQGREHNAGHYMWYKVADGSETSVQYALTGAFISAHWLGSATDTDATPLDTSTSQSTASDVTSYTTGTIVPSAGRRLMVASMGACRFSGPTLPGHSSWLNSYTEIGDQVVTSGGTSDRLGVAWLVVDGGSTTSSGSSFGGTSQAASGMVAAFKASTAVATELPLFVMAPPRRR